MFLYEKLNKRLNELKITQTELAQRLNIPKTTLNGYFTGYREPDLNTLKLISKELNLSLNDLVNNDSDCKSILIDFPDDVWKNLISESKRLNISIDELLTKIVSNYLNLDVVNSKDL